jgi:energy-coupling factor transporter ATP-binding protein EcfA2
VTGAEILALIGKAIVNGTFSQIAKRGVDGIAGWVSEQAAAAGGQFTADDRRTLEALLSDRHSVFASVAAQFKTVKKEGLALVGPSGVGKTSLFNYLRGEAVIAPIESTSERAVKSARFQTRYISVADTPGSKVHVNFRKETGRFVQSKPIDILVLMLAYGYLDTVGLTDLRRPGRRLPYETREEYVQAGRLEELEWIEEFTDRTTPPKRKIPYLLIVVNKMDQWLPELDAIVQYYDSGESAKRIAALTKHFCRTGVKPSFHPVACTYNSFKGRAPVGEMSAEAAVLSLAVLRGEITRRLMEIA